MNTAITNAQTLYNAAVVGIKPGQYPQSAKDAFHVAINAAIAIRDNTNSTQVQVDSALAALHSATDAFKAMAYKSTDISGNDDVTDVGDLSTVVIYYGMNSTSANWTNAKKADMNNDNKIDIWDLAYVATNIK
ncbi:Gellan lyase precursor [compost metagenome]